MASAQGPAVRLVAVDGLDVRRRLRPACDLADDETFPGETVNRARFALGYAKANRFAKVTQNDGIHIEIAAFPAFPPPPADRWSAAPGIENKLTYMAKDWPYYSGGGVGVVVGIRGDFAAEVDYAVESVGQATTLEMAVVNVDPGAHQEAADVFPREGLVL